MVWMSTRPLVLAPTNEPHLIYRIDLGIISMKCVYFFSYPSEFGFVLIKLYSKVVYTKPLYSYINLFSYHHLNYYNPIM
jgi:hypothetical protein